MIEIHLYGSLRRFCGQTDPTAESIVTLPWQPGDTVASVAEQVGIPLEELGANLFLNGRYARLDAEIGDGDRLGLFPGDMQLLYKWYFDPERREDRGA
jgi:molybdopterin converting factor small subunit